MEEGRIRTTKTCGGVTMLLSKVVVPQMIIGWRNPFLNNSNALVEPCTYYIRVMFGHMVIQLYVALSGPSGFIRRKSPPYNWS